LLNLILWMNKKKPSRPSSQRRPKRPPARAPKPVTGRARRRSERIEPLYRFARVNPDFQDVATSLAGHTDEKRQELIDRLIARTSEEGQEGSWTEPLEMLRDASILKELLDELTPQKHAPYASTRLRQPRHRHPRPGKR
jgi:hypothetical protein